MTKSKMFKSGTLTWWQVGLLKLSMVSIGLAVAATWPMLFAGWRPVLLVTFALFGGYVTWVWWRQ